MTIHISTGTFTVEQKLHYRPDAGGKFQLSGHVLIRDPNYGEGITVSEELLPQLVASLQAFILAAEAKQGRLIGREERSRDIKW